MKTWVLFDWEDTLMRQFPQYRGPMHTWPKVEEMADARKALHALHGKAGLAMAAKAPGATEEEARKALGRVDLASFIKHVFCEANTGFPKGTPEFYSAISNTLRVKPEQLVMVGDNFKEDVRAPLQAGLHAIWFNERDSETHAGEHYTTVHKLDAVPGVITGWGLVARP